MNVIENNIGRWVVILHGDRQHVGTVMDMVHGTSTPKRVRIQRGTLQGAVVAPRQYQFVKWLEETEVDE